MIAIKNPYIIEKAGHLAIMATDNIWMLILYHKEIIFSNKINIVYN